MDGAMIKSLRFIKALPYTKRVFLMIGLLLTTALCSYGYYLYLKASLS